MLRNILVPLDGSRLSEHSLPLALTLARRAGAAVRLVHVSVPPVIVDGETMLSEAIVSQAAEQQRRVLEKLARELAEAADLQVSASVLTGSVVNLIQDEAERLSADLVVMTTHGRGPLSRLWLGSVADDLMRQLPMPVLLIRPVDEPIDPAREVSLRRMLIPLDGSPLAEQILGPATEIAVLLQMDMTLMRITAPFLDIDDATHGFPPSPSSDTIENMRSRLREMRTTDLASAMDYLDGIAQRVRAAAGGTLHVRTEAFAADRPAETILESARAQGMDIIALESRGRGGLSRLLFGSVADKIIRAADVPVLVHCPKS